MTNLAIFVWSATPLLTVDLLASLTSAPVETLCLANEADAGNSWWDFRTTFPTFA